MRVTRQGFVFESFPSQIIHSASSQTSFNKCCVDKLHHNSKEMRVAAVPRLTSCPHLLLFDFFFLFACLHFLLLMSLLLSSFTEQLTGCRDIFEKSGDAMHGEVSENMLEVVMLNWLLSHVL